MSVGDNKWYDPILVDRGVKWGLEKIMGTPENYWEWKTFSALFLKLELEKL